MSTLQRLQDWYDSQCNGDWEHSYGVKIDTLDNPGWSLTIDLDETDLAERAFAELKRDADHPTDWMVCYTRDGKFYACCGPRKLEAVIDVFLEWATGAP